MTPPPPPPPPPPGVVASPAVLNHPNPKEVEGSYWQVVSDSNMSASALMQFLQGKGFAARLIFPADRQARVMVGPYTDPRSFEQAKSALAAAGVQVVREW